jgi:hypothetical protein
MSRDQIDKMRKLPLGHDATLLEAIIGNEGRLQSGLCYKLGFLSGTNREKLTARSNQLYIPPGERMPIFKYIRRPRCLKVTGDERIYCHPDGRIFFWQENPEVVTEANLDARKCLISVFQIVRKSEVFSIFGICREMSTISPEDDDYIAVDLDGHEKEDSFEHRMPYAKVLLTHTPEGDKLDFFLEQFSFTEPDFSLPVDYPTIAEQEKLHSDMVNPALLLDCYQTRRIVELEEENAQLREELHAAKRAREIEPEPHAAKRTRVIEPQVIEPRVIDLTKDDEEEE